jgi:hypothetical protein
LGGHIGVLGTEEFLKREKQLSIDKKKRIKNSNKQMQNLPIDEIGKKENGKKINAFARGKKSMGRNVVRLSKRIEEN